MAAKDFIRGQSSPAQNAVSITPADSDLATAVRALYIGSAGNVAVILSGDTDAVTFVAVPAGTVLPITVKQVRLTNTTATNIIGLR
jgi:hypothetical protein